MSIANKNEIRVLEACEIPDVTVANGTVIDLGLLGVMHVFEDCVHWTMHNADGQSAQRVTQ